MGLAPTMTADTNRSCAYMMLTKNYCRMLSTARARATAAALAPMTPAAARLGKAEPRGAEAVLGAVAAAAAWVACVLAVQYG